MNDLTKAFWNYLNAMRQYLKAEDMITAALLIANVKAARVKENVIEDPDALYSLLLATADKMNVGNPFQDKDLFFRMYRECPEHIDWESVLEMELKSYRYSLLPEILIQKMKSAFQSKPKAVLIAEAVCFVPHLREIVDENPDSEFVLTDTNTRNTSVLQTIFNGYENVTILNASVYSYEFTNRRFDLVLCLPAFGGRTLAEDTTFLCREFEMVALENLAYHLNDGGELEIILPGRITFAAGKVRDLRMFIEQNYSIKELAELPAGIFETTGIKTYFLDLVNTRPDDNDVIIRRYSAGDRKSRRAGVAELVADDDTFVMQDELYEQGDWNIDRIFAQQDEDWQKYQNSGLRKDILGNVAQVFRGKSVTTKDPNGSIGVVTISSIGEYELDYDGLDHLEEEDRKVANYILQEGDVLLPARGTAIRTAVFHKQAYPCIAHSNVIVIRPDSQKLDSTYLKIFLDSPMGNKLISGVQQGMAVMNISYKDLAGLEIPVPPLEEQKRIAKAYVDELAIYMKTKAEAEKRWKEALGKLQSF